MLRIKDVYDDYVKELKSDKAKVEDSLDKLHTSLKYVERKLHKARCFIRNHFLVSYDELIKMRSSDYKLIKIERYSGSGIKRYACTDAEVHSIFSILKQRLELKRSVGLMLKHLTELTDEIISETEFRFILQEFNSNIADEIIKGYHFNPGNYIGLIRIKKKKRVGKNVNWGDSNKKKAEILARGGIPYNKETAPDGEEWLVYFISEYAYWWYWNKGNCRLTNKSIFSFTPMFAQKGNLSKYRKNNPLAELKYDE